MGRNDSNNENTSESDIEKEIKGLKEKIETVEHTNAFLEDKVKQYEDPNKAIRIVRRGVVKKSLKFQANNVKCSPVDGHIINPVLETPVAVKQ